MFSLEWVNQHLPAAVGAEVLGRGDRQRWWCEITPKGRAGASPSVIGFGSARQRESWDRVLEMAWKGINLWQNVRPGT